MKYRKKPVVIEAVQFTGSNFEELGRFAGQCVFWLNDKCLGVRTLEDGPNGEAKHVADQGDWIIRGVKGEHYACKPDIFAMTYEPADARGEAEQPPPSDALEFIEESRLHKLERGAEYQRWTATTRGGSKYKVVEPLCVGCAPISTSTKGTK
jgi:hypothetical protein